ncbi:MAG: C/D box methylation guide ribonucleoprotein complex aNOP56 subunit, partial [Candidatus Bathyarchaeia archaeon]
RIIDSHETYAKLISQIGLRTNITEENLNRLGITGERAKRLTKASESSVGGLMNLEDITVLQTFCKSYLETIKLRDYLVEKLDDLLEHVAKNVRALAGATLGARLIALGGGLNRLSQLPASTIQILGAEKALFRSLKTGAYPPKHGIIFQHYLIHQASRWQRGKIARALAGKIAIASRIDAFTHSDRGDALKAALDKRVKEIQQKYPNPPEKRKPPKMRKGKRR